MKHIITLLSILLLSGILQAQDFNSAKLDSFLNLLESKKKGMGSLTISKNGQEIYQKAFGSIDIENNIPANDSTKYRIGSITKTFTATIIMQMVEEKKLSLDTRLSKYYPSIPLAEDISIEHLLRHSSGIYSITDAPDYLEWAEKAHTPDQLIEKITKGKRTFDPGEYAKYSNSNYILLSLIAEKIDGKSFADILQARICQPLKLNNTYFGGPINTDNNEALSYLTYNEWELASETDLSIPLGAGAIVSTPRDLNHFFNQLFTGEMVSTSSLEAMQTMVRDHGIGLFEFPFGEKKFLGHNGAIDGFQSNSAYYKTDSLCVSYISNGLSIPFNDVLIGVLSIYYDQEYPLPTFEILYEVDENDIPSYLGTYKAESLPLTIIITNKGKILIAEVAGQPSFGLEAIDKHLFAFDRAKLKIQFKPEENQMTLMQDKGIFTLTKE